MNIRSCEYGPQKSSMQQ